MKLRRRRLDQSSPHHDDPLDAGACWSPGDFTLLLNSRHTARIKVVWVTLLALFLPLIGNSPMVPVKCALDSEGAYSHHPQAEGNRGVILLSTMKNVLFTLLWG